MNDKKRFYVQQSNPSYVYLRDRTHTVKAHSVHTVFVGDTEEVRYLEELCALLNKGHEATEASPIDVEELREQQRAYGYRLFNVLLKRADKKSDPVERTYYSEALTDLFDVLLSGECLTRSSDKIKEG